MEVRFTPETEKKLNDLAAQNGRATADELVQSVIEGYFDELAQTREMLNSRYDDLATQFMTGYDFHPEARFDLNEIWEFIRADSLDAADRTIAEILSAIRALVPFPGQGHKRPDHLTASALHSGT